MTSVTIAATQMACDWNVEGNLDRAEGLVRRAASDGAKVILLQELFATPYFCPDQKADYFKLAQPLEGNPIVARFADLAKELGVVLPVSFFERSNQAYFNTVAIVDADGSVMGIYRKTHIPQNPGYEEKFYFNPGNTGFQVWDTAYGRIGCGICWDQWFPECARSMALKGADILLYPTAIGSEPSDPTVNSKDHWQRVMQGHAGANLVALAASNRIGFEEHDAANITFYGHSFIAGPTGEKSAECDSGTESVITATFDLDAMRNYRANWGLFRDRRPELYQTLLTLDG